MPVFRVRMERVEYQVFYRYVEAKDVNEAVTKAETEGEGVDPDDGHEVTHAQEGFGLQSLEEAVDEISE